MHLCSRIKQDDALLRFFFPKFYLFVNVYVYIYIYIKKLVYYNFYNKNRNAINGLF